MIYLDLRPAHRLWTCLDDPEAPTNQANDCATPWARTLLSGRARQGLISYLLLEDQCRVDILAVLWLA